MTNETYTDDFATQNYSRIDNPNGEIDENHRELANSPVSESEEDAEELRETASELTKFQTRILAVLADGGDYGLGVKEDLREYYGKEINNGRLYPNLDKLVKLGLVEKKPIDRRSNNYSLTSAGERILKYEYGWFSERIFGGENSD